MAAPLRFCWPYRRGESKKESGSRPTRVPPAGPPGIVTTAVLPAAASSRLGLLLEKSFPKPLRMQCAPFHQRR